MKSLILMIQFMTRYPVPAEIEFSEKNFVSGMKWMPVVGLLAGIPAALVFHFLAAQTGSGPAAVLAVTALVLATGGLHLDGLADSADGLLSYRPSERMLEIMRDPALGTNGVIAIVLTLLLKISFLARLSPESAVTALLLAPVLARMGIAWHGAAQPYARAAPGLGAFVNVLKFRHALAATAMSLGIVTGILLCRQGGDIRLSSLFCLLIGTHFLSILCPLVFSAYAKYKVGGITGDTIGASIELTEVLIFFFFLFLRTG